MEKEKNFEKTIQTIMGELQDREAENSSLRKQLGGYKRANEDYRKKITELKKQVADYKALDIEGDRLYEEKIAQCASLSKQVDELKKANAIPITKFAELEQSLASKNAFIESLQKRVQDLMLEKSQLENKLSSMTTEQTELYETIEYLRLPWYKRLFK